MKTIRWARLAAISAAVLSLTVLASCGGGDDDDSGPGPGPSGGTGSDESYVSTICKATVNFTNASKNVDFANIKSEEDAVKALVEPFDNYVKDLKQAKPPKDLKEYHDGMVKQMEEFVDALKSGKSDANALDFDALDFPEPPKGIEERLAKVAASNKDCNEAGVAF